jgi:hypothetical protein
VEFNNLPLDRVQGWAVLNMEWTIEFQNRPGISLLAEQLLVTQERPCLVELVLQHNTYVLETSYGDELSQRVSRIWMDISAEKMCGS